MRFRVQPAEIAVPDQDPFQNDLLGRNEPAEVLTHASTPIEGPSVVAIDAGCGTGKAAFVRMWARRLCNQEVRVVEVNAGETDFLGDPYIALSTELTDGLPGRGTRLKWQESDANGRARWGVVCGKRFCRGLGRRWRRNSMDSYGYCQTRAGLDQARVRRVGGVGALRGAARSSIRCGELGNCSVLRRDRAAAQPWDA